MKVFCCVFLFSLSYLSEGKEKVSFSEFSSYFHDHCEKSRRKVNSGYFLYLHKLDRIGT